MNSLTVFGLVLAILGCVSAKHEQFIGYKTYRIDAQTRDQLEVLETIYNENEADVWQAPIPDARSGYIMVGPQYLTSFENALKTNGIEFAVHVEDMKQAFDFDDQLLVEANQKAKLQSGRVSFSTYMRYAEIDAYLENLAAQYPSRVTLVNAGSSFQGRPIKYLKISSNNFQDANKPVVFIEAGIHAREWAAPPVALYSIYKLVEDITDSDLANNVDWIILPLSNPDGYEFSHTNTRSWRKTRSTRHVGSSICPGVDGNRNFDFFWSSTTGSSGLACNDAYRGPNAFSEEETAIIRDIVLENLNRMKMYISVHSFGSLLLYPWAHDGTVPSNALELHTLGIAAANAIGQNTIPEFPSYIVGNLAAALNYRASGSSADYITELGVSLSFVFELPGIGTGLNGFNLPPAMITQVVTETWEGIKVLARHVL